jgi:hypothetical protein
MNAAPKYSLTGDKLHALFNEFGDYSLSYVYKGIFNPLLTDNILSLAETNMNITGESAKTQKKVYFVMVESLQNITRHQEKECEKDSQAFFVVQNKAGQYDLTTGNIIENAQIEHLNNSIEKINSLEPDALKEYYKNVLENTGMSEKGGAGLGLIEMARRSGNKLSHCFDKVNKDHSFFYFKTKITSETGANNDADKLDNIKQLHTFSKEHKINMVYHGIFTHDNLKNLLSMTEESVNSENSSSKRKSVSVMVELLQNICNHAAVIKQDMVGKPGILVVSAGDGGCYITSGNYIDNTQTEELKNKINLINRSDMDALDDLYSEIIMKDDVPGQKGAGLGFIDIKMKSGNNIDYSIHPYNDKFSFLSITGFVPFK